MKRLTLLSVLLVAAACGSDSNSPGSSDVCTGFVNAVNAKATSCSLVVNSTYLASCQSALASCTADDKTKLGNITTCVNNAAACSTANPTAFETAGDNCVNATGPTLTAACQASMSTAMNNLSLVASGSGGGGGGGGSFTPGSGSCNITSSGATVACEEFASSVPTSALQAACVPANCGTTVSGASCSFSSGQCTATGRLGRCIYTASGMSFQISWYGAGGTTAAAAQQACTSASGQGGLTTSWIAG